MGQNVLILSTVHWVTERQAVLETIEREINKLIGNRTTGVFTLNLEGPMGSTDIPIDLSDIEIAEILQPLSL